jgi:two-component system phosphate regulon sensor histidine kinase PhoR
MAPADPSENPQILVVDDELDTRDGCQQILSRMGYPVFTASRGIDALQILENQPVTIVLLDLKMPGMDGMEVLRRIRQRDEKTLIIVITGYATVEMAIEAMKLGAYDFIAKPFDPDGLRIVVRRAHERIRLTVEAERLELERRKTLTDLLTEKSRTRTIIESLPTGVVVTNAEGKVVLANPSFFQHICLDADRPPGEQIGDYVQDDGFCRLVTQIAHGRYDNPEAVPAYEFAPPCGKYLLARGRPIIGDNGECLGAVMTVSDVSALRALDKLKSAFVAEVSHELRSPLSTIHEQLALVIRDLVSGNSAGDLPILNRALEKTHDLISLVGDLLDLSRIESGTAYTNRKPLDLKEMLKSIVNFLASRAERRGQSLALDLPEGPLPPVVADPFALESIFGNLITNALNYTQEGGAIRVEVRPRQGGIEVSVIDNGLGIEEQDLARIFDRFYRVRSEKTRHTSGTGLGLPIVKGLLDGMGGSITVRSSPGQGSVFTVLLPVSGQAAGAQAG